MPNSQSVSTAQAQAQLQKAGIVTSLASLLNARHWASRLSLFGRHLARNQLLGNVRSNFRGRGMEFEEVRRYQPGDDIRNIDWKVTARADGTYTKLFREERERPCHILVDQRANMFFGSNGMFKSVLAAEAAGGIAWAALAGGDRVGGQVLSNHGHADSRGKRSKQAVLRFLHDIHDANQSLLGSTTLEPAALEPTTESSARSSLSLREGLEECQRLIRPGTALYIISDLHDFDDLCAKALVTLSKSCDVSVLQIADPFEQNLPVRGQLGTSDGEHHARIQFSNQLVAQYQDEQSQHLEQISAALRHAKAFYTILSTEEDARKHLLRVFSDR